MAVLVWDSPQGRRVYPLERRICVIGRDEGSDVCLADISVSRRHALVEIEGDAVRVTDLGSKGGTKINGASLTPQMASTLAPGDFMNVGKLVLTCHQVAPPVAEAPAPPGRKRVRDKPAQVRAPVAVEKGGAWKWVAIGLGAVLLVVVGVLIGILTSPRPDEDTVVEWDPDPEPPPVKTTPVVEPPPMVDRVVDPDPEPETEPAPRPRAPDGALPAAAYAPVKDLPQLVAMKNGDFLPLRVTHWTHLVIQGTGRDGLLYEIPRARVASVLDRANLARSVAQTRAGMKEIDFESRVALAEWCNARFVRREEQRLLQEAALINPDDQRVRKRLAELQDE
jgi:hypothetical protein